MGGRWLRQMIFANFCVRQCFQIFQPNSPPDDFLALHNALRLSRQTVSPDDFLQTSVLDNRFRQSVLDNRVGPGGLPQSGTKAAPRLRQGCYGFPMVPIVFYGFPWVFRWFPVVFLWYL